MLEPEENVLLTLCQIEQDWVSFVRQCMLLRDCIISFLTFVISYQFIQFENVNDSISNTLIN